MLINEVHKPKLLRKGNDELIKTIGTSRPSQWFVMFTNIRKALEDKGYEIIKINGGSTAVYAIPNQPDKVLKLSAGDECYLHFINYAKRNPSPNLLKVYYIKILSKKPLIYYAVIEKLTHVNDHALITALNDFRSYYDDRSKETRDHLKTTMMAMAPKGRRDVMNLIREALRIKKMFNDQCNFDLHDMNVMKRDNGDLVVMDPLMQRGWTTGKVGANKPKSSPS